VCREALFVEKEGWRLYAGRSFEAGRYLPLLAPSDESEEELGVVPIVCCSFGAGRQGNNDHILRLAAGEPTMEGNSMEPARLNQQRLRPGTSGEVLSPKPR